MSANAAQAPAYLEAAEVAALERAATNMRDHLLVRLLFHLGCRASEALSLEVKDLDFDQGSVTILHLKERLRLACPKCNARLGPEVIERRTTSSLKSVNHSPDDGDHEDKRDRSILCEGNNRGAQPAHELRRWASHGCGPVSLHGPLRARGGSVGDSVAC
ncbi:MAG: site-specific integrase [Chloroflexota bacterium]|nr:site-specific integrase [Chloroflexota bacterium]